ncbi:ABC transporter substrate-binding protein [Pseudonocardia adelaidensis]|uniref:ABC transporter substrate-binding protein n=1 Tax=Pseudonocardia adelaidensis TaxID=648754 RepID=UPI0031EF406E
MSTWHPEPQPGWTGPRISRRGLLGAAAAGALSTALSGCGLRTGSSPDTLNVLSLGDPFFYAVQSLLPEFEAQTGIKVSLEGPDYDTLNARATNSFLTGQTDIDVISPDSMWLSRFAENEWLLDLTDLVRRDAAEVDVADFVPSTLYSLSEWRGGLYTLPVAAYTSAVLYRPSVFAALGLQPPPSVPDAGWTWDEYLRCVRAIDGTDVAGTRMHGTVVCGSGPQPVTHMYSQVAASKGARWFRRFPADTPWDFTPQFAGEQSVASLQFWKDLFACSPPEAINYLWFDAGTAFGAGNVGIFYHWTAYAYLVQRTEYMGEVESAVVDDYALGVLPVQPGQQQVGNIGGYAFGIGARSEKQEQAWTFIKWATSKETQRKMALLPMRQFADFARSSLYDDDELVAAYPYLPAQLAAMQQGDGKQVRPPVQNYTTLETQIGRELNRMLGSDVPARETADAIQRAAEQIMTDEQFVPFSGSSYADTQQAMQDRLVALSA